MPDGGLILRDTTAAAAQRRRYSTDLDRRHSMSYGLSITLDDAKRVAAAALKEAAANQWTMAVAVVDPHGDLVYFEKMDDTPLGSTTVCQDKARSAARFKRPTKVFQDML